MQQKVNSHLRIDCIGICTLPFIFGGWRNCKEANRCHERVEFIAYGKEV
jgi:hypothetical protein